MTSEEMFTSYRMLSPDAHEFSQALIPDSMFGSILSSEINTLAICEDIYALYGEEVPSGGDIQALEDEMGNCHGLIRVSSATILKGNDIPEGVLCLPEKDDGKLYCLVTFSLIFL